MILFQNPWEHNLSDSFQSYVLREFLLQEKLCSSVYFLGKHASRLIPIFEPTENVKVVFTGKLPELGEFFTQTTGLHTLYIGVSPCDNRTNGSENSIQIQDLLRSQTFLRDLEYRGFAFYANSIESQDALTVAGVNCKGALNPCILTGKLEKYLNVSIAPKDQIENLYVYRNDADLEKGKLITELGVTDLAVSLENSEIIGEFEKLELIEEMIKKVLRARVVVTSDPNVSDISKSLGKYVVAGPNLIDDYVLDLQKILDLKGEESFVAEQNLMHIQQMHLSQVLRFFFNSEPLTKTMANSSELQKMIFVEMIKDFKQQNQIIAKELDLNKKLLEEIEVRLTDMRNTFTWRFTKVFRWIARLFKVKLRFSK